MGSYVSSEPTIILSQHTPVMHPTMYTSSFMKVPTTGDNGRKYGDLESPSEKYIQNFMSKHGITYEEYMRIKDLDGNNDIVLSNGKKVVGRRSDWGDDEYYIDVYIDGQCVHSEYHYDG